MENKKILNSLKAFLEGEKLAGIEEIFIPSFSPPQQLKLLSQKVQQCQKCLLFKTKKHYVFGEGNQQAALLFVGEAPGRDEDLQGKPFIGRAGQLLTRIIESIGLKREDIYIANILKCRPPGNRNPLPSEIENCLPYLKKQIEIIQPSVICALGKFAAQTLLNSDTPISQLRGKFYNYQGAKLIPTFHPAYLLRNPQGKIPVWEDMKKIKAKLRFYAASRKPQAASFKQD
ncbi:MAG: uracil-DNA glycosylase [Candidatus Omnitrophica bacterium]|nr:uracil-DNA glycosylase [Candidatus Omnitrophota bacterium]